MISIIAIITMLTDHIGLVFFPNIDVFRIVGRLSFPLFAWGITKGYRLTKSYKKYVIRLTILAVSSQLPYFLLFKNGYLNIVFTLLLGLFVLRVYDCNLHFYVKYLIIGIIILLSHLLKCEYGYYGIITIFLFHRYWENEKVIYIQFIHTVISVLILKYEAYSIIAGLSSIIILYINLLTQRYRDIHINSIVRYSFYPAHLLILYLLSQ
jgi:hypothetical protein